MKLAIPLGLLLVLVLISSGCTMSSSPASSVTAVPTAAVFTTPIQTIAHSGGAGMPPIPIRIKENNFDPDFVTVKVGTTIVWTNEDPRTHTVTYLGNDVMRFDSGQLTTGQTFSNTFTAPGRYIYTDKQYSSMKGTILVE